MRVFKADNPDYKVVPKAKKQLDFELKCLWEEGSPLSSVMTTAATGLPMTSATALRVLCGKPGAAKKALQQVDADNMHALHAETAEALGDGVPDDEAGDESGDEADDEEVLLSLAELSCS